MTHAISATRASGAMIAKRPATLASPELTAFRGCFATATALHRLTRCLTPSHLAVEPVVSAMLFGSAIPAI